MSPLCVRDGERGCDRYKAKDHSQARVANHRTDCPHEKNRAKHREHGMREGHVREVDVAYVTHDGLGRRPLDAEIVQQDPTELHRLDGQKEAGQAEL